MKIYFLGICGVMMAPLAVCMKDSGYTVEGSDKGFYPPISTYLKEHDVKINVGFKAEHITDDIDIAVLISATLPNNPEYLEIKKKGIKMYKGYAEFIHDFILKEESIVCVGSYGKTTITAFVSYILDKAGLNPTFCIGGIPLNFNDGVRITSSNLSIVEGDEYIDSRLSEDLTPKFIFYDPKYLLINSAKYDHLDVYKTEEDYINAYRKLLEKMPKNGVVIVNKDGENIDRVLTGFEDKLDINYVSTNTNSNEKGQYSLENYVVDESGIIFSMNINGIEQSFHSNMIGEHNVKNLCMGIALASYLNISTDTIKEAVEGFKGVKRRLEIRRSSPFVVIDDLAHSPVKAQSSIDAIRQRYPERRLIAIFEPHTLSARMKSSLNLYSGYFTNTDEVLIAPIYHPNSINELERINVFDIAKAIGPFAKGFEEFQTLKEYIQSNLKDKDILLFMSSGSFGGLIDYFSNI